MIVSYLIMMLCIVTGDILIWDQGGLGYYYIFSIFAFIYIIPYFIASVRSVGIISINTMIFLFVLLRLYVYIFSSISGSNPILWAGDGARYHIPQALQLKKLVDYYSHLFSFGGYYNGRLTHVLLSVYINIAGFIGIDTQKYENIFNVAYVFNTIISITTLKVYHIAVRNVTGSDESAIRGVWFLAFNPYFLLMTMLPVKETLLFLSLALFFLYLSIEIKKYQHILILILSLFIVSMDRLYMLPLLLFLLILYKNKFSLAHYVWGGVLLLLCVYFIQSFIGISESLNMYEHHNEDMLDKGESVMVGEGLISNIARVYFGPAFIRPFYAADGSFFTYINTHIIYISQYLMYLIYSFVAILALIKPNKLGLMISISYIYVLIIMPYHSTFKSLLIVFWAGAFLVSVFPDYKANINSRSAFD